MTVSEKTVFKLAADYAARLGVSCPEIVVQNSRIGVHDYGMRRSRVGEHGGSYIMVDRRRSFYEVSTTVAHEFVHRAFPNLRHGAGFQDRVQALQRGEMLFRGSVRRPDKVIPDAFNVQWVNGPDGKMQDMGVDGPREPGYVYGKTTWRDTPLRRSVILDTKVPKEPVDNQKRIVELEARIKAFDTKIKRLTTLRKKLERKARRLREAT